MHQHFSRALGLVSAALMACSTSAGPMTDGPTVNAPITHNDATETAFPPAPTLDTTAWIKGEPVDITHGTAVVEHWATWCGPCREQMPHLSHLQATHPNLQVIGVSDESEGLVRKFVERQGDTMAYTVAVGTERASRPWRAISHADGIPHAYLVHDGAVVWNGHPEGLDAVLAAVESGDWTPATAALVAAIPGMRAAYFDNLQSGKRAEAEAIAKQLTDSPWVPATDRNDIAWTILTEVPPNRRDVGLAVSLAEAACAQTGHASWMYEDTRGYALFQAGRVHDAVEAQALATQLCVDDGAGDQCDELQARLTQFRDALPT